MNQSVKNVLIDLITPTCLILLAIFLRPYLLPLDNALITVLIFLPFALLAINLLISWKFSQLDSFYLSITLCAAYAASLLINLPNNISTGNNEIFTFQLIVSATSILIPLNFIIFKLLPVASPFSQWGAIRLIVIAGQSYGIFSALQNQYTSLLELFTFHFLPGSFYLFEHIPLLGVLLLSAAIIMQIGFISAYQKPIDSTLLGALVAVFVACFYADQDFIFFCAVSAVAIMLIIATIQASYNMAFIDTLTGLPTRRAMENEMKKLGRNYTVAMLDIDHFKKLNDTYGHDVGDQVLRMVAKHIRRVGGGGRPARYGGEEFTIIFPNKKNIDTIPFLEVVRANIAASVFALRDKDRPKEIPKTRTKRKKPNNEISVTISIGVAEKTRLHKLPTDVMKSADEALYKAKKGGRNCLHA